MKLVLAALVAFGFAGAAQAQPRFAPARPGSPYSAAVQVGDVVYLSGQIGAGPDGRLPVGVAAQAKQAMENIETVLKTQGLGIDAVFKCSVFLNDMTQFATFNEVYVKFFDPKRLPVRSAVGVNALAAGAALEVECWANAGRR